MADDSNSRSYRPANPYAGAGAAPAGNGRGGNDPLAELARLIGQNDPFADLRRDGSRGDITRSQQQNPAGPSAGAAYDPYAAQPEYPAQSGGFMAPDQQHYEPQQFEPQQFEPQQQEHHSYAAAHQASDEFQPAYDPAIYGTPQQDGYYQGPAHGEADEVYDEAPQPPRRNGLRIAMVIGGLAILGAGGAFAYRTVFSGSRATTPPPVIAADPSPSKVAPAQQKGEGSNKLIYDRIGDASQGEKVVSREEQPVDIKDSPPPAAARPVFPGIPVSPESLSAATASSAPIGGTASVGPASAEPKKIRTVTIRPDQPLSSAPPPRPIAGTTTPTAAMAPSPAAPMAATAPSPTRPVKPPAPVPQAAAAAPTPNAPLSLAPQAINPDAQMRTATAAPAPARNPAAAGGDAAGAYVQLSSHRSEPEAQASFRSLQSKFPNLLSSRQPTIRRADLGDKGIYFRAMVGPFASLDEASGFCGNLKSAGGQCVVQRN